MKNGNLIVEIEDDEGVDDSDKAESINSKPFQFGSYILSHSKRMMNDVIQQKVGFYNNSFYHTDTDSRYIHKKYWSSLFDNGFVGKSFGWVRNDYGNSGIFMLGF